MNRLESLIPAPVTTMAVRQKRLAGAFGPRFFLLLVLGLVWLGPAFREARFLYGMAAWDLLVLAAWAIDLAGLPRPRDLVISRRWHRAAALSVAAPVEILVENRSHTTVHVSMIDNVPPQFRREAPDVELSVGPGGQASARYEIVPRRRGEAWLGAIYLRYQGPMRIAEGWAVADLRQKICVYPNLPEAERHSVYLMRSRQIEMERRYTRVRGAGREFESLREYREGDEYRHICWTATGRRGKLVTRVYQMERSQTVWLVIDSGRLMRAQIAGLSKLDYAATAALSLGQVALGSGDRVGLLAYGRRVQQRIPPYRGSLHLRQIIDGLAHIEEEPGEADHLHAVSDLLTRQQRRSLIVWLTDFPETAMTPEVIEAASRMTARHLVLFIVIGQPDLAEAAAREPRTVAELYQTTAAQEMLLRREFLLARLRQQGALAAEVNSAAASAAVVSSYLEVKERNLL
jgi:uncharacterized protein (DUF58 family)